jgi:hypothetical protein
MHVERCEEENAKSSAQTAGSIMQRSMRLSWKKRSFTGL